MTESYVTYKVFKYKNAPIKFGQKIARKNVEIIKMIHGLKTHQEWMATD